MGGPKFSAQEDCSKPPTGIVGPLRPYNALTCGYSAFNLWTCEVAAPGTKRPSRSTLGHVEPRRGSDSQRWNTGSSNPSSSREEHSYFSSTSKGRHYTS